MNLKIKLGKSTGMLEIWDDERLVDKSSFDYGRDLSFMLIDTLDKLLKKTTIDVASISSYSLDSASGPDSTATKIGEAFVEGLQAAPLRP